MPRDTAKLHVFQLADRLVLDMDDAARALPRQEQFEIGRQLRRAALSVPTNLIEGDNAKVHANIGGSSALPQALDANALSAFASTGTGSRP